MLIKLDRRMIVCNCIETINKKMADRNLNTVIDVPLLLGSNLEDQTEKTKVVTVKADQSVRKRPVPVFASFCPFCGVSNKTND